MLHDAIAGATTTATASSTAVAGGAFGPDDWRKWGGNRLNQGSASSTGVVDLGDGDPMQVFMQLPTAVHGC